MAGIIRGAGKTMVPMLIMLICWCVIRVAYITITVHFIPDIRVVFWGISDNMDAQLGLFHALLFQRRLDA